DEKTLGSFTNSRHREISIHFFTTLPGNRPT
ncbi:MAG: hypothetical protein ACI8R4_003850, partial [Paracoccaceae bacterium]